MKYGDLREDGFVYIGMTKSGRQAGQPKFLSPAAFAKMKASAAEQARRYREDPEFRESWKQRVADYNREDYRRSMLKRAKCVSKQQGLPFNLESIEDIPYVTHCPVFGVELVMGNGTNHRWSPSLDKIVPAKGYVKGNVVVVSLRANMIKSNASVDELEAIAKFYKKLTKGKSK